MWIHTLYRELSVSRWRLNIARRKIIRKTDLILMHLIITLVHKMSSLIQFGMRLNWDHFEYVALLYSLGMDWLVGCWFQFWGWDWDFWWLVSSLWLRLRLWGGWSQFWDWDWDFLLLVSRTETEITLVSNLRLRLKYRSPLEHITEYITLVHKNVQFD